MCGIVTSRSRDPNLGGGTHLPGYSRSTGLLLGNKFVPNPCLRAASLKGPTHRPFLPPFPSRPPGGLPAAAFLWAAPGPGAAARGGTRLGARASARTMTPFPFAAASSPTPPPSHPQANLLAFQADKTPRPRALSRGAPGRRH